MATEHRATTAELTLTNWADAAEARAGRRPAGQVRSVTVANAVVLPGMTITVIAPPSLLARLGLAERQRKPSVTPAGVVEVGVHEPATAAILGRSCTVEPVAGAEGGPVLVGQMVLDQLDWVIDPDTGHLVGNPAHGGEWGDDSTWLTVGVNR